MKKAPDPFLRTISAIVIIAFVFTLGPLPSAWALRQTSAGQATGIADVIGNDLSAEAPAAGAKKYTLRITELTHLYTNDLAELSTNLAAFGEVYNRLARSGMNVDRVLITAMRVWRKLLEQPNAGTLATYMSRFEELVTYLQEMGHLTLLDGVIAEQALMLGTGRYRLEYVPHGRNVVLDRIKVVPLEGAVARAGGAQIAEELARLHPDELLEKLKFTASDEVDVRSVPEMVRQFMAEKGIPVLDDAALNIIKTAHTIATVIDRFKRFETGFHASLDVCEVSTGSVGRINTTYIIKDRNNAGKRYVVQKLGDFFEPEAIEYQLVSLEMAQDAIKAKMQEDDEEGKRLAELFKDWTFAKYYNIKDAEKESDTRQHLENDTRKLIYIYNPDGTIKEAWRVMEFMGDEEHMFFPDSGAILEKYRLQAARQQAQGIQMLGVLLSYVPKERLPGPMPLPFYHNTAAHVREVRALLRGRVANVLPSRKDKMRPARMIPGLLDDKPENPDLPFRERTLRLKRIFNLLTSAPSARRIGFLAQDFADYSGRGPQREEQDVVIQDILFAAISNLAHNDPKFDNWLFRVINHGKITVIDKETGEEKELDDVEPLNVAGIVDWDTLQIAGLRFIDFADALHFPVNPAGENPWEKFPALPFSSVTVSQDIFEDFIKVYLKGYTEEQQAALRPHLIWATAKVACELATRFFKAYLSEYADVSDSDIAGKKRHGVYFADTSIPDKNLRLAEVRYKVCLDILRTYGEELGLGQLFIDSLPDPIGWGAPAVAAARGDEGDLVERARDRVAATAAKQAAIVEKERARIANIADRVVFGKEVEDYRGILAGSQFSGIRVPEETSTAGALLSVGITRDSGLGLLQANIKGLPVALLVDTEEQKRRITALFSDIEPELVVSLEASNGNLNEAIGIALAALSRLYPKVNVATYYFDEESEQRAESGGFKFVDRTVNLSSYGLKITEIRDRLLQLFVGMGIPVSEITPTDLKAYDKALELAQSI